MLNGIDISGWQSGIDISAVDADFVIAKATGGISFVNPDFYRQADQTLASGKLLGIYHFAGDNNPGSWEEETEHFLEVIKNYIGRAVLVLDWEADATEWPIAWAENWMQKIADATGSTPWFYSYSSYVNSTDCSSIARFPLWIAAYYDGYEPMGYQDNPPLYGGTGNWPDKVCYQYSSTGIVDGYDGRLDINKFYGSRADFESFYSGSSNSTSAQDLIDVAYSYLGTTEDDPRFFELIDYYNEHTDGYDMQYWDEWCACFVSVCSLKSGNASYTGTSVNCATFRSIWQEMGIYRDADSIPSPGWLIDYDWQQDGIPDHIGIVVDCDGSTIHVIEGNAAGEVCAERWIPVGDPSISCFAAPNYPTKTKGDDEPMQFIYQPDGKPYLVYHDGTKNTELSNSDQVIVIQDNYRRCTGRDIPCFELGTPEAQWAARFEQVFPYVYASNKRGGHAHAAGEKDEGEVW